MIKQLFKSFHPLEQLEKQRILSLSKGGVPDFLLPLFEVNIPTLETPFDELDIVVLDFETSGLNPEQDKILSVGMVEMYQQVLSLSTGQHYYLLESEAVKPETAVINHIIPETLVSGLTQQECIKKLVDNLAGKIVVAHGALIEKQFIRRLFQLPNDAVLPIVWLDTLMLEKSLSINMGKVSPDFMLCNVRAEKGLPPYLAHNALADAVATGELLLVLVREIFAGELPTLGPLVQRSLKGYT